MMGGLRWIHEHNTFIQQRQRFHTTTNDDNDNDDNDNDDDRGSRWQRYRNIAISDNNEQTNNRHTDTVMQGESRLFFLRRVLFEGQKGSQSYQSRLPSSSSISIYLGASRWMNWKISMADRLQAELQQCLFYALYYYYFHYSLCFLFYLFMPFCFSNSI